MKEQTNGGTYTRRGHIHGGEIHTKEQTYGDIHGGDIPMKEQTYGETYTWWSVHTVGCIHGGDIHTR